jgi:sensor histidine kinase YesM
MKIRFYLVGQIFLWLLVWLIISLNQGNIFSFLMQNSIAFGFQVALILMASYLIAPKLMFQKNYALFLMISIALIAIGAFLSSQFNLNAPPRLAPPMRDTPHPPSAFVIHMLLFSVTYILAILIETFLFAQKKEQDNAKQKTALIESELNLLKMQINPHFLFNALNNIYSLSVQNSEKTQDGISTLSEMLRYVIYDCEQPKVSIEKELNYIENYIHLFKFRSKEKFDIKFNCDIKNETLKIAPMLLIPFIENAFKHSGIEKRGKAFVHISLKTANKEIELLVENAILISNKKTITPTGIGLANVKKRLILTYPNNYNLNIEKTDTFKVRLKLKTNG